MQIQQRNVNLNNNPKSLTSKTLNYTKTKTKFSQKLQNKLFIHVLVITANIKLIHCFNANIYYTISV